MLVLLPDVSPTDSDNNYGLGEITHGQFTYEPIIGLIKHFSNLLKNLETENINQAWEKIRDIINKEKCFITI